MKRNSILKASTLAALILTPVALIGCGGGGGGGGGSNPSPTATAAGARALLVQLRDSSNLPVDGIVTVGATVRATTSGQVTISGLAAGSVNITVEVNGVTTSRNATVASSGTTTFVYLVSSGITPTAGPTSTVPPPPF